VTDPDHHAMMEEHYSYGRHIQDLEIENERLRTALQALHDWYVEYARINNLFNADGSPATFHELLEARRALEPKP
jgi:hypothetical protein